MNAELIALLAYQSKTNDLINFVKQHKSIFGRYQLISTENTSIRIQQATGLEVNKVLSSYLGGYSQIASQVAEGNISAVVCLLDPISNQNFEPDLESLLRLCNIYDIPLATNLGTAQLLVASISKTRFASLIFNPVSGQGNAQQDLLLIRKLLEPYLGLKVVFTSLEKTTQELVEEAIADQPDLIIASGGDGTISAVAGGLINTNIPLGVIPRGTANAFAMALGIPMMIRGACDTIISGATKLVDIALCNQHPMILLAGIGYEAETVEKANREVKNRWGPLAYIMAGIQQFNTQEVFNLTIDIDGVVNKFITPAITIANVAPRTSILAQGFGQVIADDGLLEVMVYVPQSRIEAVQALTTLVHAGLFKVATEREDIICARGKKIAIVTDTPQKVVLDGEIIGTTPVQLEAIPKGLTVIAPTFFNRS